VTDPGVVDIRLQAIGLVRAKMERDGEGMTALLADVDWVELASCLIGMIEALLLSTLGDRWTEQLDHWRRAAIEDTG
jgi:hypothetical protein